MDGRHGTGGEAGQALVLGALFVSLTLVLLLAVPALGLGYAERAAVQSAADAAALACAAGAEVTRYVDARGAVYGESAHISPVSGAVAAAEAWGINLAYWPLRTTSFSATASGAECLVRAEADSAIPAFGLLGRRRILLSATAEARAYPITP